MQIATSKRDIRLLGIEELTAELKAMDLPSFRAKQIFQWIWQKGATSFEEMTNLSLTLREQLSSLFLFRPLTEDVIQHSRDGTIKCRLRLHDGLLIETVLIPVTKDNRYTVCVSSQVGCSLSCTFCATGKMKRMRNLDPAEIVDQVRFVNQLCLQKYKHPLTNIVYMGMGEPLLNYQYVNTSINMITSAQGLGMSPRRITISTAGISKIIRRLADEHSKVNLALSLHAATDQKRDQIMPINEQNNLAELIKSIKYYYSKTRNKVSFEYITFKGFNDTIEDAKALVKLCKHFPVLVNIIEYNPISGVTLTKSDPLTIDQFATHLRKNDIMVTVRKSRGKDIDAACGQLANKG